MKKVLKPKFEKLLDKIEKDIRQRKNLSRPIFSPMEMKKYLLSL